MCMEHFICLKKKIIFSVLMGLFCFLCAACSENEYTLETDPEPKDGEIKIYCINSLGDSLQWENIKLNNNDINKDIDEICRRLKSQPSNTEYISAIPENVIIKSFSLGEDGQLVIDFSSGYSDMDSVSEVLCRSSVVKTLCQLKDIEFVEIKVEGQQLILNDKPVGLMAEDDFVGYFNDGSGMNRTVKITLYMADEKGKMLVETALKKNIDGTKSMEEIILNEIIAGPADAQKKMKPVLNRETVVNRVHSYDGICHVDFNEKFLMRPNDVSDEVSVYSVVNSLCELPNITKVRITVNGSEKKAFGKVPINDFLSFSPEMVIEEKAGENTGNSN